MADEGPHDGTPLQEGERVDPASCRWCVSPLAYPRSFVLGSKEVDHRPKVGLCGGFGVAWITSRGCRSLSLVSGRGRMQVHSEGGERRANISPLPLFGRIADGGSGH